MAGWQARLGLIVLMFLSIGSTGVAANDPFGCKIDEIKDGNVDDISSKCDFQAYGTKLVIRVGVWLVIAVLLLIACPIFYTARSCCDCCGSSRPTEWGGVCCSRESDKGERYYSLFTVRRIKVIAVVLLIFALIAGVILIIGASKFEDGADSHVDAFNESQGWLRDLVTDVLKLMDDMTDFLQKAGSLTGSSFPSIDTQGLKGLKGDLENDFTQEWVDRRESQDGEVLNSTIILAVLPAVLILIVVVCGFLNCRAWMCPLSCCLWLMAIIYFLVLWLFAMLYALHCDACDEAKLVIEGNQDSFLLSIANSACGDLDFDSFNKGTKEAENRTADKICEASRNSMKGFCGSVYNTPTSSSCRSKFPSTCGTQQDLRTVLDARLNSLELGGCTGGTPGDCSIEECIQGCTQPELRNLSSIVSKSFDAVKNMKELTKKHESSFESCGAILAKLLEPFEESCEVANSGLQMIVAGMALLGICLLLGVAVALCGSKRFLAKYDTDEERRLQLANVRTASKKEFLARKNAERERMSASGSLSPASARSLKTKKSVGPNNNGTTASGIIHDPLGSMRNNPLQGRNGSGTWPSVEPIQVQGKDERKDSMLEKREETIGGPVEPIWDDHAINELLESGEKREEQEQTATIPAGIDRSD